MLKDTKIKNKKFKKNILRFVLLFVITYVVMLSSVSGYTYAAPDEDETVLGSFSSEEVIDNTLNDEDDEKDDIITIGVAAGDENMASVLQMLAILTVISLAPSILIMVTSFTRIVIVLHFTRAALNTQTTPPNQVLVGLALSFI